MLKKLLLLGAAAGLVLSLSACGVQPEQLPTLSVPGETASSAPNGTASSASAASGTESGVSSETATPTPAVKMEDCEDNLDGLCKYLEGNYAVTGDRVEMSYKEIGAIGGYRYKFLYNGGTVQVEVYEFDLENLDDKGRECLDSVKKDGKFTVLDNEVPAQLNGDGKYMLIYTDSGKSDAGKTLRETVTKLFTEFKA